MNALLVSRYEFAHSANQMKTKSSPEDSGTSTRAKGGFFRRRGDNTSNDKAGSRARVVPAVTDGPAQPTPEEVEALAFQLYQKRIAENLPGDSESDWRQAEAQLGGRRGSQDDFVLLPS